LGEQLAAGTKLGDKYEITGPLGEGGMGVVYEALHLSLGKKVAVKTLLPELGESSEMLGRFQQEARVAGAIGHPNIVEVFDLGRLDDGTMYLVMERLIGHSVAERLAAEGRLPAAECVEIAVQTLAGLGAAHRRGLVHRDLKPENIYLCDSEDTAFHVKVLDFGVSKVLRPMEFTAPNQTRIQTKTRVGTVVGTPMYMAPEQAAGVPDIDQRADLWAMGVVLYEMMTGVQPFSGQTYPQILRAVLAHTPAPLSDHLRQVNPQLESIVTQALAKERDDRFPDAKAMRTALLMNRPDQTPTAVVNPGDFLELDPEPPANSLSADAFAGLADAQLVALDADPAAGASAVRTEPKSPPKPEPEPKPKPEPEPKPTPKPERAPAPSEAFAPPAPNGSSKLELQLEYNPRTPIPQKTSRTHPAQKHTKRAKHRGRAPRAKGDGTARAAIWALVLSVFAVAGVLYYLDLLF